MYSKPNRDDTVGVRAVAQDERMQRERRERRCQLLGAGAGDVDRIAQVMDAVSSHIEMGLVAQRARTRERLRALPLRRVERRFNLRILNQDSPARLSRPRAILRTEFPGPARSRMSRSRSASARRSFAASREA